MTTNRTESTTTLGLDSKAQKRWGRAVRLALNELIRLREECCRQQFRIESVLERARDAFDSLQLQNRPRNGSDHLRQGAVRNGRKGMLG